MAARLYLFDNRKESRNPYRNLAVEEYLTRHCPEGSLVLYLWQNRRTVVIGRNQNAWGECNAEALERDGGHLARRLSGGGAVYHDDGNLNFTFCAPDGVYDEARQVRVIARAAESFGISVEKTGRNDITAEGRKFSGNAYYHTDGQNFHHGTILISADMGALARYLDTDTSKLRAGGVKSVPSKVVNLSELNPAITPDSFAAALKGALAAEYGGEVTVLTEADFDRDELADREAFFASWDWRYGQKIPFTGEWSGHFPWGFLRLYIAAEGGVITDASVDSDGMASEVIAAIPKALIGARYSREAMDARLCTIPVRTPLEEQVIASAAGLIRRGDRE